jgi:hypothetical protein
MRRIIFLCLVVALCPALLWAGPIYGTIFFNGGALRGASISIACAGDPAVPGSTLDDGSYRDRRSARGPLYIHGYEPQFSRGGERRCCLRTQRGGIQLRGCAER